MSAFLITISNTMLALSQLAMMIAVAQAYGGVELGQYSLVLAAYAPVLMLVSNGQRIALLGGMLLAKLPREVLVLRFAALIAGAAIAALLGNAAISGPNLADYWWIVAMIGYGRLVDGWIEVLGWLSQRTGDSRYYLLLATLRLAPNALSAAVAILVGVQFQDLWRVYGTVATLTLVATGLITRGRFSLQTRDNGLCTGFFFYAMHTLAQGFPAAIESLMVTAPRYILGVASDLAGVAAYTLLIQITNALGLVASAQLQADIPRVAAARDLGRLNLRSHLASISLKLGTTAAVAAFVVALIPDIMLGKVFGVWFLEYRGTLYGAIALLFIWYFTGYLANVSLLKGHTGTVVWATVLAAMVVIGLLISISANWSLSVGGALFVLGVGFVVRAAMISRSL